MKLDITKEEVLNHIENKILDSFQNEENMYQDDDGEWVGEPDAFSPILSAVSNRVADKITHNLLQRGFDGIKETVDERINTAMESKIEGIMGHKFIPIDNWGKPTGEPTTVKDEFLKRTGIFWLQKVDKNGKPDNSSYGEKQTRAEYLAQQYAKDAFDEAMKENMEDIVKSFKQSLSTAIKTSANLSIDDAISKLIKV